LPLVIFAFKVNTFRELSTKSARAQRASDSRWRVTLNVAARIVAVDAKGVETERPMRDLVEIGIYDADGKPLYLRKCQSLQRRAQA
jgi:ABC-2 type transport system permease protein